MTNISLRVHNFLLKNPNIVRHLQYGIINIRALAALIKEREKLTCSHHAIISSVRRFDTGEKKEDFHRIDTILRNSKISTKSRLILINIPRNFDLLAKILPKILAKIDPSVGGLMRVVQGRESFKLLVDQSKGDEIRKLLGSKTPVLENIAEINIRFGPKYEKVRGKISAILSELAVNNIFLHEAFSCLPEFIILVDERDVGRAHDALLTFFHK